MLIEFSVSNFRSIRGRQTLSLVSSNREADLPRNLIDPRAPGLSKVKLVKSAVVYGANASGKSNLYRAAAFMRHLIRHSAIGLKPNAPTGTTPFRLDPACTEKPSEFEAIFLHEGVRYQYGFAVSDKRVLEEWLTAYPSGSPQKWFQRSHDRAKASDTYVYGPSFTGEKKRLEERTRGNALFLSMGAQFDHPLLSPVYEWFGEHLRFLDFSSLNLLQALDATLSLIDEDNTMMDMVRSLVQRADLGISGIALSRQHFDADNLELPDDMPEEIANALRVFGETLAKHSQGESMEKLDVLWRHQTVDGGPPVAFESDEESAGTLKFLSLLGPWLDSLAKGHTVFVDEVGAFMHPLLMRSLVALVNGEDTNAKGAQLVFTTHDVTLLDTSLFRRDQIWFTEKTSDGATSLYPLTDYKPRKEEALQKGYLAGRYGAIPFLKGELAL